MANLVDYLRQKFGNFSNAGNQFLHRNIDPVGQRVSNSAPVRYLNNPNTTGGRTLSNILEAPRGVATAVAAPFMTGEQLLKFNPNVTNPDYAKRIGGTFFDLATAGLGGAEIKGSLKGGQVIAKPLLRTILTRGAEGAAYGGIRSLSQGDKLKTVAQNTAIGGVLGGAAGGILEHGVPATIKAIKDTRAATMARPDFKPGLSPGFAKVPGGEKVPAENPLLAEARKYKSAEEFVRGQGQTVYRGGLDLSKEKITNSGISVSKGKNVAEDFVKQKGGTVQEHLISPDAKIINYTDVPNVKFKNLNDYSPELDTGNKQIWRDLEVEYQKAVDWAKSNGYDGVKLPLEGETRIINLDVLKTKSQLTDLWNEATKGKVLSSDLNPKKQPKSLIRKDLQTALDQVSAKPTEVPGGETRGFIKTLQESPKTKKQVLERISGQYIPRSTDELSIKAKNLINDNIGAARDLAIHGTDENAVATASELINHYQNLGDYDSAVQIANNIAPKLTELGRAVQAASIYNRLTPEGVLRFAQSEISKARASGVNLPDLTSEQAQSFLKQAKALAQLPEGRNKALATQKLLENIQSLVPSPFWKKAIAVWKAGLLTGVKTTGVNTLANTTQAAAEIIKDVPATFIDNIASLFTKNRTKTLTTKGYGTGFREGISKGWDYLKSGYDERNIAGKFDYHKVNFGKSKIARSLQAYEESIFRLIGSEDQPFYYGAKARSIYDQSKAATKNLGLKGQDYRKFVDDLVKNPTDDIVSRATYDAQVATFQNNTQLGQIAAGLQKTPGGQILAPFTKTPSAVATSLINYTPFGVAKTIIENIGKGRFDQRAFSEGLGRGLTGSAVLAIGVALAKKGMITGGYPKDAKERALWELEGKQPNSILIGGKWRSLQPLGIPGGLLAIGSYYHDGLKDSGSPTEAAGSALAGIGKYLTDQTFLQGISKALAAVNDPVQSATGYIKGAIGGIVPTIVSDTAKSIDPYQRETNTVLDSIKSRVPGVRNTLLPKRDVFGGELPRNTNALQTFFDPFRPSDVRNSPLTQELRRLQEVGQPAVPTKLDKNQTIGGQKVTLTPQELDVLEKQTGLASQNALNQIISSKEYSNLSDEQKSKVLKSIVEDIRAIDKVKTGMGKVDKESLAKAFDDLTKDQKMLLTNPKQYIVDIPKEKSKANYSQAELDMISNQLSNLPQGQDPQFLLSSILSGRRGTIGDKGISLSSAKLVNKAKSKLRSSRKKMKSPKSLGSLKKGKISLKQPKISKVNLKGVNGKSVGKLKRLTLKARKRTGGKLRRRSKAV